MNLHLKKKKIHPFIFSFTQSYDTPFWILVTAEDKSDGVGKLGSRVGER